MLVFTLIPIGILWARYHRFLWLNRKVIGGAMLFGVLYQIVADPFAESWRAWFFTGDKVIGLWVINFPIENTLFFILIPLAIASATLVFIRHFNKQ